MVSSVTYANSSAIFGLTAKQSTARYQANSADAASASANSATDNSTIISISQEAWNLLAASQASSAADPAAQAGSGVLTYDFTNMTPANMLATVNGLIKSGQMSLDESSSLVGIMGLAGAAPQSFGLGPNAANQPMDFMSSLRQMLSYDRSINNASGVAYDNKALSALEGLQGTPSSVNLSVS